ncbi:MAG: DUF1697 domain-containing protein [Deltaproteobacteria bacterium]|nr:DUF1697 domain-containing protein [Deltaproteobacteria bacterium]
MPRYAAFLRGVSPVNCSMADLKRCVEKAGFSNVVTVLASGNVVFDAAGTPPATLERALEGAMDKHLGRTFGTMVRSMDRLHEILAGDPYQGFKLPRGARRVVTFLRQRGAPAVRLPVELDGPSLLTVMGAELFSAYVPSPKGPVFMTLIERSFGKDVTTRTWDTLTKVAAR